jgi:hypothetical protein
MTKVTKQICKLAHITDSILVKLLYGLGIIFVFGVILGLLSLTVLAVYGYILMQISLTEMYIIGMTILGVVGIGVLLGLVIVEHLYFSMVKGSPQFQVVAWLYMHDFIGGMFAAIVMLPYGTLGLNGLVYYETVTTFPGNSVVYIITIFIMIVVNAIIMRIVLAAIIDGCHKS